jgi:hypothetical protein
MEERSRKAAWQIMLVPHGATFVFGLIWIIFPGVFLRNYYPVYIGPDWVEFLRENASLSFYISSMGRFYGIWMILFSFYTIATTVTAYKRREKWAWYAFLIANTVGYGCVIIGDSIVGLIGIVILESVLLIIAYVGLSLAAKTTLR